MSTGTRAAAQGSAIRNIVFVHGAWADGSSWSTVIPLLEAQGFHTIAVQNPLTSLADDVAATKRAIADQAGPVLLVGHSYGGTVITEAGDDPKVAGLVYVAAFAPDAGQSTFDAGAGFPTPGAAEVVVDQFGFLTLTPKGIRADFAQDLSDTTETALTATQGPTFVGALTAPVSSVAWKLKPTSYIVAKNDRMIDPALERIFAMRMNANTIEIPSSHVVMLSHPHEVAAFIRKAAGGDGE
jgi:pimeloyl-ACP methyl ester carboxylesterase